MENIGKLCPLKQNNLCLSFQNNSGNNGLAFRLQLLLCSRTVVVNVYFLARTVVYLAEYVYQVIE